MNDQQLNCVKYLLHCHFHATELVWAEFYELQCVQKKTK